MIDCGSLDYAQARLQARHGQREGESTWQRLATARQFAALVEIARQTSLRPWLVGITAPPSAHQIEAVMRGHWRRAVSETVGWMPSDWHAALAWCALLPDLPLLQHLARGAEASPWMQDDPDYRRLCALAPAERSGALAAAGLGDLAVIWGAPQPSGALWRQAWHAAWQARLPRGAGAASDSLQPLVAAVRAHAAAFAAAPPGPDAGLRRSLQDRLSLLLRRAALTPAAAFIHLALAALDLERLRGELLRRALFNPGPTPRQAAPAGPRES